MKILAERYQDFKMEVIETYSKLVENTSFNIAKKEFERFEWVTEQEQNEYQDELKKAIEDKDINTLYDFDFFEVLPVVYFNDRRGDELRGYVFEVSKEDGILVYDEENYNYLYISFTDINLMYNQINLIEQLGNF